MSFEVSSGKRMDGIDMIDCLKYLDKGKVIHKGQDSTPEFKRIHTIFSYKQKTYKHTLVVYHSHELFNSYCHVYDFDIPLENN